MISEALGFSYKFINRHGLKAYIKQVYLFVHSNLYELYYGVKTKGFITPKQLGISGSDSIEYTPLNYHHIKKALASIPVSPDQINLLDYGCGKGRVLIVAASLSYRKIIGIEISSLAKDARHNLDIMRGKRCKHIEVLQQNAVDYIVPDDINVIYFFKPFVGETLNKVIEKIESSFLRKSRKIYIIFFNNQDFDAQIAEKPWLQKISQANHHLGLTCGIYYTESAFL